MATVLCPTKQDLQDIVYQLGVLEAALGSTGSTLIPWVKSLQPGDIVGSEELTGTETNAIVEKYRMAAKLAGVSVRFRGTGPARYKGYKGAC